MVFLALLFAFKGFSVQKGNIVTVHICRSTVNFAREVAETKSMDDAINRLEGMFTGVDPVQNVGTAKRGETYTRSPATTATMLAPGREGGFTSDTTGRNASEVC